MNLRIAAFSLIVCCTSLAEAQQRQAAQASEWIAAGGAQVRLLAAPVQKADPDAWQDAGIEIRLEPGAKTYWRSPGDTGVPPVIDFTASRGVRDITVDFPAPVAFDDGAGGLAIGYNQTVILPFRFRFEKPPQPVASGGFFSRKVETPPQVKPVVDLGLEFGVCVRNMCIPAQAKLVLPVGAGVLEAGLGDRLSQARSRVPVRQKIGASGPIGISSVQVRRAKQTLEIEIGARFGSDAGSAGVFVEAKEAIVAKRLGMPIGDSAVFIAKSNVVPDGKLGEARITLATVSGAIDVVVDLDAASRRP